jgi:catechol 2,3-dioxygenase-like lactoylglutathione lyase family enzyme
VLGEHPLNPILPAQDAARAERFYRDVLGLEQVTPAGVDPMAFRAGEGTTIMLSELRNRQPPSYPVVSFNVTGIEELASELEARDVQFEALDVSSFRGLEGKVEGKITDFGPVKSAWFRDSEGNILAMNEVAADFRPG